MESRAPDVSSPDVLASIVGELRSNPHLCDVTTVPLLTAAECDVLLGELDEGDWREMKVWETPPAGDGSVAAARSVASQRVRRGLQQPLPGGSTGLLASRLTDEVVGVNHRVYRFRLVSIEHPIQVLRYGALASDGYVDHVDIGPSTSLRKLSFSLLLSDPASFDGGDLSFGSPFPLARAQGTLTIFPSYVSHSVAPVTRGTRHAVVGFALGPAFS
jgi:PKHD-type hydroxylase